ncbi:MAG: hypothetical protein CMM59_06445 [Rhodospirillaceae bacterium]|nr:hypothetical protein [Rhodospirillaceae bacterium]|tara:strand:+ start:56 stop:883 length:828 start_codon:yes stop_codon:yes gene_type:complete
MKLRIQKTSQLNSKSRFLQEYRNNVTTQRGEDGIINAIFNIIGTENKYCIEFGAWDGKLYSNTWNLINNFDWEALLIEANKQKFGELETEYENNRKVAALNCLVNTEGKFSLDSILKIAEAPSEPDFLSIDVDGLDWYMWESLLFFAPRLIVVEFNPTISNDIIFIQDNDPAINQGCSLAALIELGHSKSYELIATTSWNAFFVKTELFDKFGIEDNSINAMHDPAHFESRLFQCYDGSLVLAGCKHLLWHDVSIAPEDIQVLPKSLRKFDGPAE